VKNLAIIDEVEVDFSECLNVLTGETGAGKSIIIGSINTALGGKVSKDLIRRDAEFALIELLFQVKSPQEREKLEALGISFEDDTLLISRKITASRTINRMNGESVTVGMIRQAAELLIDIHGQNEQQSLLRRGTHLEILDRYAREEFAGRGEELAETYREYRKLQEELSEKEIPEEERLREISFLQYELEEIENAKLEPGEEGELEQVYRKLSNATEIAEGLSGVYQNTSQENGSVSERLGESIRTLTQLAEYDDRMSEFLNQISEIDALVTDFNRDISDYMDEFDVGTEEFAAVEKRLDLVRGIKAKYGKTTAEVRAYGEKIRQKLAYYEEYDVRRRDLRKKLEKTEAKLQKLSREVSEIRRRNGKILEKEIIRALKDLNFLQVQFRISVEEKEEYTARGKDEVEFMISTNPGMELRPLGKAASGGELSRIMLAIKAVIAGHDEIETMIFDEIDVGISGRTAQMVAEKMAMIGRSHQVICISHLSQIAAMADTHFLIEKENEGDSTHTEIRPLTEEESVEELARILGGAKITEAVRKSAEEMRQLAKQTKESA